MTSRKCDVSIAQGHVSYTSPGAGREVAQMPLHFTSAMAETGVDSSICIGHGNGYGNTGDRQKGEKKKRNQRNQCKGRIFYRCKALCTARTTDEKVRIELVQDGKTTTPGGRKWLSSRTA